MLKENTTLVLDKDHPLWQDVLRWASEVNETDAAPAVAP